MEVNKAEPQLQTEEVIQHVNGNKEETSSKNVETGGDDHISIIIDSPKPTIEANVAASRADDDDIEELQNQKENVEVMESRSSSVSKGNSSIDSADTMDFDSVFEIMGVDFSPRAIIADRHGHQLALFSKTHACHDDALLGLLTDETREQYSACCCYQNVLYEVRKSGDKSSAYTAFGKRLKTMSADGSHDILENLCYFWVLARRGRKEAGKNIEPDEELLRSYLASDFTGTDTDNVEWTFGECSICLAACRFVRKPPCCQKAICQICWQSYVKSLAANSSALHITGVYNLHCHGCNKLVPFSQALACSERSDIDLIKPKNAANSETACPNCFESAPALLPTSSSDEAGGTSSDLAKQFDPKKQAKLLDKLRNKKGGHPHICKRCGDTFCRFCGTSDHRNISCYQVMSSDKALKVWTKQKMEAKPDFSNARRCPKCKTPVAHSGGCSHMTCPCGAEFCYHCGCRMLYFPTIHSSSKFVPFISCRNNWKSQPSRLLIHSAVALGLLGLVPVVIGLTPIVVCAVLGIVAAGAIKHAIFRRRRIHGS